MDRPRRRPTLQWGHGDGAVEEVNDVMEGDDIPGGFNGATAMEPWKSLILVTGEPMGAELQWGHGDGAVEEPEEHLERKRAARASMGPRRWSRGRVHHAGIPLFKHRCFNGATAMEPWKSHTPDTGKRALLPSEWVTLGHFSVGHLDKRIF